MPDDALFCPACGTPVRAPEAAPVVEQPVQPVEPVQPVQQPVQPAQQPAPQSAVAYAQQPAQQPTYTQAPAQQVYSTAPAVVVPVAVAAPAQPEKSGGAKKGIIIAAAVVAVVAAVLAVLMVTGVIGPSAAGANAVRASSVTRIVPQSADGTRIVQYTATLTDEVGNIVAAVDVSGSNGFTMSDFAAPDLKKGSYTIDIRDKKTDASYAKMPVAYDPDDDKAPETVAVTPPAKDGDKWTVQPDPEPDAGAEDRAMYSAYYQTVQELQKKCGEGQVKQVGGAKVAVGLSLVKFIDFDEDGTVELMVGYTEKNASSISEFSGIGDFHVDVYGWKDGKSVQLAKCTPDHTNGGFYFFTLYNADKPLISTVSYDSIQGGGYNQVYELAECKDGVFNTVATWGYYGVYTQNSYTEVNGERVDSQDRNAVSNALKKEIGDYTRTVYRFMQAQNSSVQNGTEIVPVLPDDIVSEGTETVAFLKENGETASSVTPVNGQVDALTQEAFGTFPQSFSFSSGVGGWGTSMTIQPDGTFEGAFHDSDMGDTNNGKYPKGTLYLCEFSGKFSVVQKAGENEYKLQLDYLKIKDPAGEKIVDGQRQVYVDSVHGLGKPSDSPQGDWYMYMPGYPVSQLSDSFKTWTFIRNETTLPFIGLEDRTNQNGWRGANN